MKTSIVFEVNDQHIKMLAVNCASKVTVSHVVVLETAMMTDEDITRQLINMVKSQRLSFHDARIVLMLPRSVAILRQFTVPSHDAKEIASMIELQIMNNVPYVREEVEIDYHILNKTPEGFCKILTVVVPHDAAMRYWNIFTKARIPIHGMTITSEGLWRWAHWYAPSQKGILAVMEIDEVNSEICLCTQDYWLTSRDISVGHKNLIADGSMGFLRQWQLTLKNPSVEKLTEDPSMVYAVTSAVAVDQLVSDMKEHAHVPVEHVDVLQNLNLAKGVEWPLAISTGVVSIVALVGMALDLRPATINLIPTNVRHKEQKQRQKTDKITVLILGAFAAITLIFALRVGFIKQSSALNALELEYKHVKKSAAKVETQLNQLQAIEDIVAGRLVFVDIIDVIYGMLPAKTSLVNLSINNGKTLSMQGMSFNAGDINQLQTAMVNAPVFSNVKLDYVNKRVTQEGEVNYFKITAQVVDKTNEHATAN